jgi:hypothetical protein
MPALLIIGLVIILGGGVLFAVWFEYLWNLIRALLPLALIGVGGVIAYFGWEEKKDRRGAFLDFSSPTEASRYQAEALAYQEKINGFNEESGLAEPPSGAEASAGAASPDHGLSACPPGADAAPAPDPKAASLKSPPETASRILQISYSSGADAPEPTDAEAAATEPSGPNAEEAGDAAEPKAEESAPEVTAAAEDGETKGGEEPRDA